MKTKKLYLALALGLSLAFTGCSNDATEPEATEAPAQEATHAAAPHAGETAAPMADSALSGTVVETFESGGYTYILLDNGQAKIWAAVGSTKVEVGQKIELTNGPVMKEFHSRSLDRTFPEIVFSAGIKGQESGSHAMMGKAPQDAAHSGSDEENFMAALGTGQDAATMDPAMATGGSGKAVVNAVDNIKVDKATGDNAYTVADVHAKAKDLNGKKVLIKAKIVKISPQIMGKNWLHLQDGSGNPMHNTHDLVVTTDATPELDSIVTIEGVVAADKDFGSGYFYEVIVEEGVVK